jgi:hypothetical protein
LRASEETRLNIGAARCAKKTLPDENPAGQKPRIVHLSFGLPPEKGRNEALIALNLVLRVVPIEFTAVMITSAIPAAIRAYSIAVAPD